MSVAFDPTMTIDEKRALLAAWASDARAVENYPTLRRLDDGSLVRLEDITRALKKLDVSPALPTTSRPRSSASRDSLSSKIPRLWRRHNDDDDNQPTAPAGVLPRPPILQGGLAAAAWHHMINATE